MSTQNTAPARKSGRKGLIAVMIVCIMAIAMYGSYRLSDAMGPVVDPEGNAVGGRFRLMDASDGTMTDMTFRGRWMLMMFGAVHSADDSSTKMLAQLSGALHTLDPSGHKIAPVFISMDPQRDLSEQLRRFALQFPVKIIAGTGAPATLAAVTKEFHATVEKKSDPEWTYAWTTAPQIVVMNPEGRYAGMIPSDLTADEFRDKLQAIMAAH